MLPPIPPNAVRAMRPSERVSAMLTRVMRRRPSLSTTEIPGSTRSLLIACAMIVALVVGAAGCAVRQPVEQRTTQGPTARQMFNLRIMGENGREPTFEERRIWDTEIEEKISAYLRAHPEKANSLDVSTFRYLRQAAVGMDKEQILILLGAPVLVSGDQGQMAKLARGYWPKIEGNATEVWVYPLGWNFFFAGPKLVDITQFLPS
jgi:hypothetical protein